MMTTRTCLVTKNGTEVKARPPGQEVKSRRGFGRRVKQGKEVNRREIEEKRRRREPTAKTGSNLVVLA
jgi:hypothetical protein